MTDILTQFTTLPIVRFEIVLQSQTEAVLPALIGSTLRGAFGHALKAISCSVEHRDCEKCFLSDACLYPTVFEPVSTKNQDIPRPFIFEPPIPPLTREISENQTLKLRVAAKGKISFGLTLVGEAAKKLPYFIYAFELMARHGLGVNRQSFSMDEVFCIDSANSKHSIYTPDLPKISAFELTNLGDLVKIRLEEITPHNTLNIHLKTPLRIRRNKKLLENLTFSDFFKQCSLRLKFLFENYAVPLDFDYQSLIDLAKDIEIKENTLWRHNSTRRTNRHNTKLDLDGILGEVKFYGNNFERLLPIIICGEILHIGSAASLGLGNFSISFLDRILYKI